jgi:hypothetical protein
VADDDLTVGELGRMVGALRADLQGMIQGINARLDRVVSTDVYTLQSAHTDQRITDLTRDLQAARSDIKVLEDAFEAYKLAEAARRERERQARLYQMVVPVLLALLSAAVAIWAVTAS